MKIMKRLKVNYCYYESELNRAECPIKKTHSSSLFVVTIIKEVNREHKDNLLHLKSLSIK